MLVVPPPPGTAPEDGEIASLPTPAATDARNESGLLSLLDRVRLNCTGACPCWSVTDDNALGTATFSSELVLTKRTTPIKVVVVPFPTVVEETEMFPLQLPGPRPVVTMLMVSVAGVELPDATAWSQPCGQRLALTFPSLITTEVMGSAIPELTICVVCCGKEPAWPISKPEGKLRRRSAES